MTLHHCEGVIKDCQRYGSNGMELTRRDLSMFWLHLDLSDKDFMSHFLQLNLPLADDLNYGFPFMHHEFFL
jgi:hypothetical protein